LNISLEVLAGTANSTYPPSDAGNDYSVCVIVREERKESREERKRGREEA
jgi:hypothetical protein